jgi:hypothetical protein
MSFWDQFETHETSATPAPATPATPAPTVDYLGRFLSEASTHVYGQSEALIATLVGCVARKNTLLQGSYGEAKTMTAELVASALPLRAGMWQLNPYTEVDEILGGVDIEKWRDQGEFDRHRVGLWVAELAILDELDKAQGAVQNCLLRALNERQIAMQGEIHDLPLQCVIAPINDDIECPATDARFVVRIAVKRPSSADYIKGRKGLTKEPVTPLSADELGAIRKEAKARLESAPETWWATVTTLLTRMESTHAPIPTRDTEWLLEIASVFSVLRGAPALTGYDLYPLCWMGSTAQQSIAKSAFGSVLRIVATSFSDLIPAITTSEEALEATRADLAARIGGGSC